MSGIAGFIKKDIAAEQIRFLIDGMVHSLRHRGPDDLGTWVDPRHGVALGATRLAIIDLSSAGNQPIVSASGRTVIVYNGEVYNYRQLALDLARDGIFIKGESDTEVVLEAIERWGLENALRRFNGMFSLAVWDVPRSTLTIARDRVGERPLYYGWIGKTFVFASDLKAIEKFAAGRLTLDPGVMDQYLRFGYIPAPLSIYREISKLLPGHYLQIDPNRKNSDPVRYWTVAEMARAGTTNVIDRSRESIAQELETLITDSVRLRLVSHVPVGAVLSESVSTGVVAAIMQRLTKEPIKTFSVTLPGEEHLRSAYAQGVAKHIGSSHTALVAREQDVLRTVLKLPFVYDEPFAQASQLPFCLLSEMARRSVTVLLSGEGADEQFCGYPRYDTVSRLESLIRRVPMKMRQVLVQAARWFGNNFANRFVGIPPDELSKLPAYLQAQTGLELYDLSISHWLHPEEALERKLGLGAARVSIIHDSVIENQMMCIDQQTSLPDGVLTNIDRAGMAVGLEVRQPFLDTRLMEYAWQIPLEDKLDRDRSVIRAIQEAYLPKPIVYPEVDRYKPLRGWLRGMLREWAEDLLNPTKMAEDGIFNTALIQERWQQHQGAKADWEVHLWDILMFQAWLRSKN